MAIGSEILELSYPKLDHVPHIVCDVDPSAKFVSNWHSLWEKPLPQRTRVRMPVSTTAVGGFTLGGKNRIYLPVLRLCFRTDMEEGKKKACGGVPAGIVLISTRSRKTCWATPYAAEGILTIIFLASVILALATARKTGTESFVFTTFNTLLDTEDILVVAHPPVSRLRCRGYWDR